MNSKLKKRSTILLAALWGNDDASSSIRISPSRWSRIQKGEAYQASAWSYYEGKRYSVLWKFNAEHYSIVGNGDAEWVDECHISDLLIQQE